MSMTLKIKLFLFHNFWVNPKVKIVQHKLSHFRVSILFPHDPLDLQDKATPTRHFTASAHYTSIHATLSS